MLNNLSDKEKSLNVSFNSSPFLSLPLSNVYLNFESIKLSSTSLTINKLYRKFITFEKDSVVSHDIRIFCTVAEREIDRNRSRTLTSF